MADWSSVKLEIPGKDLLEPLRGILETLMIFLEVIKAILQVIQVFLIDFPNPLKALLLSLLALVNSLFESLKRTGLFAWYDIPDPMKDPNFYRNSGGFQAFTERFKASLFDTKDPNRPQPLAGANKSGFVILMVDVENVFDLLKKLGILMRFFGKELTQPQYGPPTNAKVTMADSKDQPLLRVRDVFSNPPKALVVEWGLSDALTPPDPGFSDMVSQVGATFIPQKFLIEKSTVANGEPLIGELETVFENKQGQTLKRQVQATDQYGDPVRVYQEYIVMEPSSAEGFIGQLTKFRYIDKNVKPDTTYYYRVRAFSGGLALSGNKVDWSPKEEPNNQEFVARWPGDSASNPPVMGRPTTVLSGRIPTLPAGFDVIKVLEAIFQAGFSLGFHLSPSPESKFNANGDPIEPTELVEVGRGSLSNISGPVSNLIPIVFTAPPEQDAVSGSLPDTTWQQKVVKFRAAALANTVGNSLLENSSNLLNFRTFMQGTLAKPITNTGGYINGNTTTPEKLVVAMTTATKDYKTVRDKALYDTALLAYTDLAIRQNVLSIVNFIKAFTLGGNPPDWVSISLFRDVVPWAGALIYEILAKVDALVDAFKGAAEEIGAFINLLIKKIEVLERFVKFLVSILDLILSFSISFSFLNVTGLNALEDWISAIDNAGNKPIQNPGGYTGGVCIAYVAPNVTAFETALDILF